jgi:hypothetical protein
MLKIEDNCITHIARFEPEVKAKSGAGLKPVSPEILFDGEIPAGPNTKAKKNMVLVICPFCHNDGEFCLPCDTTGKLRVSKAEALKEKYEILEDLGLQYE